MSRTISLITPSSTFQNWYDKTNETASAFAVAVTIGDGETNSGNVAITGTISASDAIKTDLISAYSPANTVTIDVESITLEGDTYFGTNFKVSRNVDENALSIDYGTSSFTIDGDNQVITATDLVVDNDILPADLSANTFNSTYGLITLNQFTIDANTYDTDGIITYGDENTSTHNLVGAVSVKNSDGTRGTTTSNLVGDVTGSVRGDVLATDETKVLENGADGTDAWFMGQLRAEDGTVIVDSASTRNSSSIVAGTIQGTTITATTTFSGDLQGNVVGDLTGKIRNSQGSVILTNGSDLTPAEYTGNVTGNVTGNLTGDVTGDVKATNGALILDTGNGTTIPAEYIGNSIGDLTGSVFADDESPLVDAINKRLYSGLYDNNDVLVFDPTPGVRGVLGNVWSDDGKVLILQNSSDGNASWFRGDVRADNRHTVLSNGTDGTNAWFKGQVYGNVKGDVEGNLTGNVTGDVTGDLTGNVTGNVTGDLTGDSNGIHYGDVYRQNLSSDYDIIIDVSKRALIGNVEGETIGMVLQNEESGRSWYKGDVRASNGSVVLYSGTGGNATFTGDADGDHTGSFTGDVTVPAGSTLVVEGTFAPPENFYTVPRGAIVMWSGPIGSLPSGWGLCDGSTYTYNNHTTVSPNLVDRFIVGAGNDYNIGATGGANSVTLTTSQMPSHRHGSGSLVTNTAGEHRHQIYGNDRGTYGSQLFAPGLFQDDAERLASDWADTIRPAGNHSHTISGLTGYEGSGQAHENRPPFYALAFIIRL